DQPDRTMGIHVIRPVLGVVLDDEDGRLLPERPLRDSFDQPAQCHVVTGDAGLRRECSWRRAAGVVLTQAHDDEPRPGALIPGPLVLFQEHLDILRVAHAPSPGLGDAVVGANVANKTRDPPFHARPAVACADALAILAVAAVTQFRPGTGIPEIA